MGSLRGDVNNYNVSKDAIWKVLHRVRESSSITLGLYWHLLETTTSKEDHAPLCIMRWKCFLSAFRIRVKLFRQIERRVFISTVHVGRLVAAGYRSRYPEQCCRLAPDHCRHRRMLADRPQNWNHQHWSDVIFSDESRACFLSLAWSKLRLCSTNHRPGYWSNLSC